MKINDILVNLFIYLIVTLFVFLVWNYNIPEITGWGKINYGQAISITVLVNVLLMPTYFVLGKNVDYEYDKEE